MLRHTLFFIFLELFIQKGFTYDTCSNLIFYRTTNQGLEGYFDIYSPFSQANTHIEIKVSFIIPNQILSAPVILPIQSLQEVQIHHRNNKTIPFKFDATQSDIQVKKVELLSTIECRTICTEDESSNGTNAQAIYVFYPFGEQGAKPPSCNITNTQLSLHPDDKDVCGIQMTTEEDDIITLMHNGEEIELESWPWLVAVYIRTDGIFKFRCGGTLLSEKVILTVAHAVQIPNLGFVSADVRIVVGVNNVPFQLTDPNDGLVVQDIIPHIDYDVLRRNYDADIALIVLKDKVVYSSLITPICLHIGPDILTDITGETAMIAGWGQTDKVEYSEIPMSTNVTIVSETECRNSHPKYKRLNMNRIFCAGNQQNEGPCIGDSGSPLAIFKDNRWQLIGTPIFAIGNPKSQQCNLNHFVGYANLLKYMKWITDHSLL